MVLQPSGDAQASAAALRYSQEEAEVDGKSEDDSESEDEDDGASEEDDEGYSNLG